MVIALLYTEKNIRRPQKHREPNKSFYKRSSLPNKKFQSNNSSGNHFQTAQVITDHNPVTQISFAKDHQIVEIHDIIQTKYYKSNRQNL